jgi:predicted ArsR family transcriptional regulator
MSVARWDRRFFDTTRGRIVLLVRNAARTVEDLAHTLRLTDNAVRAHLAALERDGLIEQVGVRRGGGKPSYTYGLSADAEALFPKAYAGVLAQLLNVLHETLPSEQAEAVVRDTARRLATRQNPRKPTLKAVAAARLLDELGGLSEVRQAEGGRVALVGGACPLEAVLPGHRYACDLLARVVEAVVETEVTVRCEPPHCRFEFDRPD